MQGNHLPDLSPLVFIFFGYLKEKVYIVLEVPETLHEPNLPLEAKCEQSVCTYVHLNFMDNLD